MKSISPRSSILGLTFSLAAMMATGNIGCQLHHRNTNPLSATPSSQPDRTLFDAANTDIDHGRYTVARLKLETLMNTYPDSEYLARAKMLVADSWYREGGTEGLAQAEAQYKDFITFFPTMNEASEAQFKVAQIHYRQLQKPDRDPTEANRAEDELRTFMVNYPDSPLHGQAVQMLRDVQEVLGERAYRIAYFDITHDATRTGEERMEALLRQNPLYSRGDQVTLDLANSYVLDSERYDQAVSAAGDKYNRLIQNKYIKDTFLLNAKTDRANAVAQYQQLILRYPASPLAKVASAKLTALHEQVPTPSPAAIDFNKQEIAGRKTISEKNPIQHMLNSRPREEIARADKVGMPQMTAVSDANSADNIPFAPFSAAENSTNTVAATGGGTSASSGGSASAPTGPAPLQFGDVPQSNRSQGVNTQDNGAPVATVASNLSDPNAVKQTAPSDRDNTRTLTPDEVDVQNEQRIVADEIHRAVPTLQVIKTNESIQGADPNAVQKKKSWLARIF